MSLVHGRASKIFGAHMYGQAITFASNFVLPIIMVRSFGAHEYGKWVFCFSISQLFLMADLGVAASSGNFFSRNNNSGETGVSLYLARQIFELIVKRILIINLFGLVFCLIIYFFDLKVNFIDSPLERPSDFLVLFFLIICATTNPINVFAISLHRVVDKQARGIIINNSIRAVEVFLLIAVCFCFDNFLFAALGLILIKFSTIILQFNIVKKFLKNFTIKIKEEDTKTINKIVYGGKGYLFSGVWQNIQIHFPVVAVGFVFGAAASAAFSIVRTISRVPVQICSIVIDSVAPDQTDRFFSGKYNLFKKIMLKNGAISFFATIMFGGIFSFLPEGLINSLLGGEVEYSKKLLFLVSGVAAAQVFCQALFSSGNSAGIVGNIALVGSFISIAGLIFSAFLASDLYQMVLFVLLTEIFVGIVSMKLIFKKIKNTV